MKTNKGLFLLIFLTMILTACNASLPGQSSIIQPPSVKHGEGLSPFSQFEELKKGETGFDGEQVDNILREFGIYDRVMVKAGSGDNNDKVYKDAEMSGFDVGDRKIAVMMLNKSHLYIFVMFSNTGDKWIADGFACQSEREKPAYRVEQSADRSRYWLVVSHEANHGTGLLLNDEIWYAPDGTVAAEYPLEGSASFFPQNVVPDANAYFSTSAYYDGGSRISLDYSISFEYGYGDSFQDSGVGRFQSKYSPVIREYWEYDLTSRQFEFKSCDPALTDNFKTLTHAASAEYGILQGYIDFYRARLGDKRITTLGEWENFIGVR